MPFLKIQTNQALDDTRSRALVARASAAVARELGKSERYVMVSVEHNPAMLFAGSDAPLAYLELKSIGLPAASTADVSRTLCELVQEHTGIDPERIYIEFSDTPRQMWGWNRGTF